MVIDEKTQELLTKAKAFAVSIDEKSLDEMLDYLDGYAEHGDRGRTKCLLYGDFAPFSFGFTMFLREDAGDASRPDQGVGPGYRRWFNGGLIYFGPGESGVGDPQFSVDLGGNTSKHRWTVHT